MSAEPGPPTHEVFRQRLPDIAAAIRTASAGTEGRFLELGSKLETAIGHFSKLVSACEQLIAELEDAELWSASRALDGVALAVAALGDLQDGRRQSLARITELAGAIGQKTQSADAALKPASVLAVNAKIEAARLGEAGADFINFSNEISLSFRAARATLSEVGGEISDLRRQLQSVRDQELELDRRKAEAVRRVPEQITASTAAINAHGRNAASSASVVATQSQNINRQIAVSVMALQIGDATRQRAEHVDYALGLVLGMTGAAGSDGDGPVADRSRSILAACCALQSAQLRDAADELDREVGQVRASLRGLAKNAREVARIGAELYGADRGDRNFLQDLEKGIAEAQSLFGELRSAREAADRIVTSVSDAAIQLAGRVGALRSLAADVQRLALNAFLKCERMGDQGKALSVIAQELRLCTDGATAETAAVTQDLQAVLEFAGGLTGGADAQEDTDADEISGVMVSAVERLANSGRRVSETLAQLGQDSETAARLIATTEAQITVHEDLGRVLRQAAAELDQLAGGEAVQDNADRDAYDRLMASIYGKYTMAREREIHALETRPPSEDATGLQSQLVSGRAVGA
jgi:methyl-accepting chemotaxis protein